MLVALVGVGNTAPASAHEVLVFAASSLTDALTDIGQRYEKHSENEVRFSFASSSTLARQIALGATAGIYISADVRWMDYLEEHGRILPDTRVNLLANRIVLVAPASSAIKHVELGTGAIPDILGDSYLAMGNPAHVPAGIYGKQALKSLGVWQSVRDRIARAADVRAALALIATGEAPLGIVYRTGALAEDDVRIVAIFPGDSHAPVIYPAALTRAGEDERAARDFFQYMQSRAAGRIFRKYGFKPLDETQANHLIMYEAQLQSPITPHSGRRAAAFRNLPR